MSVDEFSLDDTTDNVESPTLPRKKHSVLKILVAVMIVIVTFIIGIVTGGVIVGSGSATATNTQRVASIAKVNSVLDSIDSLRDTQLHSLSSQLTLSKDSMSGTLGTLTDKETAQLRALLTAEAVPVTPVDKFLSVLLAVKPGAAAADVNAARAELKTVVSQSMTQDELNSIMQAPSAAKQLNTPTKLVGASRAWPYVVKHDQIVYAVVTPVATEHTVTNQLSVVTLDRDNRIAHYTFVGIVQSPSANTLDTALKQALPDPAQASQKQQK